MLYKLIAPAPFGADQETGKSRHMLRSQFEPDECNITSAGSMVNPNIAEGPLNHGPPSIAIPSVRRLLRVAQGFAIRREQYWLVLQMHPAWRRYRQRPRRPPAERKGVGIVPKRRGGITVAEPLLGPEQLAPTNQKRGDGVAQAVEADLGQVRLGTQLGEPVAHATGRMAPLVVDVRQEDPLAQRSTLAPPTPGPLTGPPELDGGPAEGEPSGPFGLGGPDLFPRDPPFDSEHPAVQIAELEGDGTVALRANDAELASIGAMAERQSRGAHVLTMHLNTRFSAHLMLRVGSRGSMQQCPPTSELLGTCVEESFTSGITLEPESGSIFASSRTPSGYDWYGLEFCFRPSGDSLRPQPMKPSHPRTLNSLQRRAAEAYSDH